MSTISFRFRYNAKDKLIVMDATQRLEATQVLDFSSALDDEEAQEGIIVGRLVVEGVTHLVGG